MKDEWLGYLVPQFLEVAVRAYERKRLPKYRRRNFFVKKRLQGRFIAGFSIAVFLGYFLNLLV